MIVSQYFRLSLMTVALCTPIMSQSGTVGSNDQGGINPGFIGGIEGGIANVDWSSIGGTMGGGGTLLNQTTSRRAFPGTYGLFAGYKFPILASLALEPMVAYHQIGKSGNNIYRTVRLGGSIDPINTSLTIRSKITMVDLTIQGIYRLENGVNFFIQPGVAIIRNQFDIVNTLIPDGGSGINTSFRPEIAIGLGKMITNNANIFAKYTYIRGNDLNPLFPSLTPNIGTIDLGVSVEA